MKKWFIRYVNKRNMYKDVDILAETEAKAIEAVKNQFGDCIIDCCVCVDDEKVDTVNHPSHYTQGSIECIEAIKAATVNLKGIEAVCVGNAIKYIWRFKEKNGVIDLDKAIWYINKLKKEVENARTENSYSR